MLECPKNEVIFNSHITVQSKVRNLSYDEIVVSVSGGADSDIMIDLFARNDVEKRCKYVFVNTGLEYQATKDHIKYLEKKYDIIIKEIIPETPIPSACKRYGVPFLSKWISECISRLQKHDFCWEDRPFEELYKEYPDCKNALEWWCNRRGEGSSFNIERKKYLKEFLVAYPPVHIAISNRCCKKAKKEPYAPYRKQRNLSCIGVRKAEGGARATAYKNCFTDNANSLTKSDSADEYRPIFWYKNGDKQLYNEFYHINNSKCYTEYGLSRTGCVGCPFGKDFQKELEVAKKYEPKLYEAAYSIFKESYAYTSKYLAFVKYKETGEKDPILEERFVVPKKVRKVQLSLWDTMII